MKPHEVRFHHIRDHNWPKKFCTVCLRMVPTFHKHWPAHKDDIPAIPSVDPNAKTNPEHFR